MAGFLTGDKGAITYAGSDGPVVADVFEWTMQPVERKVFATVPFGWRGTKKTMGPFDARGTFKQFINDTTPPLPGGGTTAPTSPATAVFFLKNSTRKYTLDIYITSMSTGADGQNASPTIATYSWVFAGDASTDTITVA